MSSKIDKFVSSRKNIIILYILLATFASFQAFMLGHKVIEGRNYTHYNNYKIFERSFYHLKGHQDLYKLYPEEHWDYYKYTPTFSVIFSVFSLLPDWAGLLLWNLLNVFILFFAVYFLPKLSNYQKGLILIIILIELLTSIQNSQSNALIAGLILFSFGFLERNKIFWAALCISISVFIKLFGLVALAIFIFYPSKIRSILYFAFWTLILFLLPLIFVSFNEYLRLFQSYSNLLASDHSASYGLSLMGLLYSWFNIIPSKNIVVGIGALILLIPLAGIKKYENFIFRVLMLCSVLLWVVIFNHKAESPTFILAMSGVAIWFVVSKKNLINNLLFIFALILTSLSPTDIFPAYLRENFVNPYTLKVLPCILIWIFIVFEMVRLNPEKKI